ncbi:DNA-binding protein [Pseudomonas fluorescens]|uniref:DNA-binding protein n=1 Tax=Pseudomonas fluorescens TaxID=294 RepID=UPI00209E262A|nr:DNA-binding protein [Pseudomonas fluorescens]
MTVVKDARSAILARGQHPSIDAVRVELGNTGSRTTISRYLKEIEELSGPVLEPRERFSAELQHFMSRMLDRMMEESGAAASQAKETYDQKRAELEVQLESSQLELTALRRQYESEGSALEVQTAELQTSQTILQAEITRNAHLSQNCSALELRVQEKDERIRSLEEKHVHARDALEHYRSAFKEQREQEQRRHKGQVQQLQVELRQLQQTLMLKQDELTHLNRDNERLLIEARQQSKAMLEQEDSMQRLTGELNAMKTAVAKEEGVREMLREQLADSAKRLEAVIKLSSAELAQVKSQLKESSAELMQLQH